MKSLLKMICCLLLLCGMSCKKYLDLRPDKRLVIPTTLEDCQSLLNNAGVLGPGFPTEAEISTDDYTLPLETYNSLQPLYSEPFIWKTDAQVGVHTWALPYNRILVANQILFSLDHINRETDPTVWDRIKGSALLLRSVAFLSLANLFTQPYDPLTAGTDLGIPLKMSASISEAVNRGTVQQTYDRIVADLTEAVNLLPAKNPIDPATRSTAYPVKVAAQSALARVLLIMGKYEQAFDAVDSSLKQYHQLMDFSTIDTNQYFSFERFNAEVLYETSGPAYIPASLGIVSTNLLALYEKGDLRKALLFRKLNTTDRQFKGGYDPGNLFNGFATNENYLIRAECEARRGNTVAALADLNTLKLTRWVKNDPEHPYVPITANNATDALRLVLLERRKELPFTTLRWMDLRRLNKEPQFAVTLTRKIGEQVLTLPPNDLRYTLLIPREVLERNHLPQNPR